MLGGCSSINGMIYIRGQARDYDLWRQMGNAAGAGTMCCPISAGPKRITAAKMTPTAARASCASNDSASAGRSSTPWRRRRRAGIPRTDDFNRGDNEGAGYFEVNQKGGLRWNARRAFLDPVRRRPNLARRHRRGVLRLSMEGRRAPA